MELSSIKDADGLSTSDAEAVDELVYVLDHNRQRNEELRKYYDGEIVVPDLGLDIDTTEDLSMIQADQVCHWAEKAVDALAERIELRTFVTPDTKEDALLSSVLEHNHLENAYMNYLPSKLMHGCAFAAVNMGEDGHAHVRMHTAETASALESYEYETGAISAGMCVAEMRRTEWSEHKPVPTKVNLYLPNRVVEIRRRGINDWSATSHDIEEPRPMMVSFTHGAYGQRPFGKSRITRAVRSITREAVRTMFRMSVLGAFYSLPSRALLNLTDEQYDAMMSQKMKHYVDRLLLVTQNDEGSAPQYMQLAANSPQPLTELLRTYASILSGATGVPLNSLGIVSDNPSSAEAITASTMDICNMAAQDIRSDTESLQRVIQLALAVEENTTTDNLSDYHKRIIPDFQTPSLTSLAGRVDAATKMASTDERFAGSYVYYKMMGISDADIKRISAAGQEQTAQLVLQSIMAADDANSQR